MFDRTEALGGRLSLADPAALTPAQHSGFRDEMGKETR